MKFRIALLTGISLACLSPAQAQYVIQNKTDVTGDQSVTLNGVTFTNNGLVGVGRIPASTKDFLGDTLGSFSSLAIDRSSWRFNGTNYTGKLFGLPDRGYNDPSSGFYSNYSTRLFTFDIGLTPYRDPANLPANVSSQNQLTLKSTGGFQLTDDKGQALTGYDPYANVGTLFGRPAPSPAPGQPGAGLISVDAEGISFRNDGSFYLSDEYGPAIYHFNAQGRMLSSLPVPDALIPRDKDGKIIFTSNAASFEKTRAAVTGRRENQGLEGLSISPDGKKLFALLQSGALQDLTSDATSRRNTRLIVYDISQSAEPSTWSAEYALQLPTYKDKTSSVAPDSTANQSEMLAINDRQLLVLTRDGNGYNNASPSTIQFKSVMLYDISNATNFAGTSADAYNGVITDGKGNLLPTITPAKSVEVVNLLNTTQLSRFGISLDNTNTGRSVLTLSEKWEGMALVPTLREGKPNEFFLFVSNDNDFLTQAGVMQGKTYNAGVENDTQVLIYQLNLPTAVDPLFYQAMMDTAPVALARLQAIAAAPAAAAANTVAGELAAMRRSGPTPGQDGRSAWVAGQLSFGDDTLSDKNGSRDIQSGTFGLDTAFGGWRVGLAATVARVASGGDVGARPGTAIVPMIYAGWFETNAYAFASMGWAPRFSINGISRPAAYGLLAKGETKAESFTADAEAGYRISMSGFDLTPFAGLTQIRAHTNAFTETGAAGGDIAYASNGVSNTRLRAGMEASTDWRGATAWVRLGWLKSLTSDSHKARVSLAYVDTPIAAQTVSVTGFGAHDATIGAGLQGALTKTLHWRVGYDGSIPFNGGRASHGITGGLRASF
jgi:outer membrane autotransporter protein